MINIFKNPQEGMRIVNIIFLILILAFIGNLIYGFVFGNKNIDCIWNSGLLFLVMLQSWVLALRPFVERVEKEKKEKKIYLNR